MARSTPPLGKALGNLATTAATQAAAARQAQQEAQEAQRRADELSAAQDAADLGPLKRTLAGKTPSSPMEAALMEDLNRSPAEQQSMAMGAARNQALLEEGNYSQLPRTHSYFSRAQRRSQDLTPPGVSFG